jgi:hypothetical protein
MNRAKILLKLAQRKTAAQIIAQVADKIVKYSHQAKSRALLTTLLFVFSFSPFSTNAEMPSKTYEKLKFEASEKLTINIKRVETKNIDECITNVTYAANIIEVCHSNSNLKVNDVITIHSWTIRNIPVCAAGGPRAPKLLSPGWIGTAYLSAADDTGSAFKIAAHGESFIMAEACD